MASVQQPEDQLSTSAADAEENLKNKGEEVISNEFQDPAILVLGAQAVTALATPLPLQAPPLQLQAPPQHYRYSPEVLLKLRDAPASQTRPMALDPAFYNRNGVWEPDHWHSSTKAQEAAENGGGRLEPENHKRRAGDPRERIRKEQDGIVLSPQRRSFNSGCFVPVREPPLTRSTGGNRAHSPLGGGAGKGGGNDGLPGGAGPAGGTAAARRIGSGRILPWDYQDKADADNDFGYRGRERRETDRDRDERFERRSFGRDYENKDKDRHIGRYGSSNNGNSNNSNSRFSGNRRISNDKEEEPEWFSSGPMSQNDTIELRGFEDTEKPCKRTRPKKQKLKEQKQEQKSGSAKDGKAEESTKKDEVVNDRKASSSDGDTEEQQSKTRTPTASTDGNVEKSTGAAGDGPHVIGSAVNPDASFNFEDILKCESIPDIPGLLSNGLEAGDAAGSRFSRWFRREKSPPVTRQQTSQLQSTDEAQDHHRMIKNLLGGDNSFLASASDQPSVAIPRPGDAESYFAPISPAGPSNQQQLLLQQQQQQAPSHKLNLMEMLQRSNKTQQQGQSVSEVDAGKILSLEELESRMLQGGGANLNSKPAVSRPQEEDMNAFKRLFAQINNNHHVSNGPQQSQKPMSLMEMLSHSQQQDEAARMANHQRLNSVNAVHHIADMSYKLQQVQNQVQAQQKQQLEMLSKLMNIQQPQMDVAQSMELLNRPEAQAILQGLKRGDITPQHLYQQLANPAMQPRHRELLYTIIKTQVGAQAASPVPPQVYQQQQQQLRVSPLPPNAMHQRIPSPRELQVHTQNIMQRALIKKKLEEQEENFRKKQQAQHRGASPAKTASPTPLAFTPTAVLRKMTADKDDGSKDAKEQKPIGRAVTGMRVASSTQQQQQQQQQLPPQSQIQNWNSQFGQHKQPVLTLAGRPIVKNNNYQQQPQSQQQDQFYQQQQHRLMQQQQQQRKNQQTFGAAFVNQQQQQHNQQQQYPQLSQQQLRAQHQNVRAQHQQTYSQQQSQQPAWAQQMLHGQGFENRQVGRGGMGDGGDLSPTSNQLARWFSPDLLERARKGKLPGIPPTAVSQHALSLEEVERHTTTTPVIGHN